MGCEVKELPSIYLGMPLFKGPLPTNTWNTLIDRFQKKLAGWKGSLLTKAGKLQLLKSSLQNLPMYLLFLFKVPREISERIEQIQRRFLWSGMGDKNRI